jgi:hypothetical protein
VARALRVIMPMIKPPAAAIIKAWAGVEAGTPQIRQ